MSGKKRVKYTRPTTRNEDSGAVCGAWAPRPGSGTDTPSALVLLGRDGGSENGVAVRHYDFDADSLSESVRESLPVVYGCLLEVLMLLLLMMMKNLLWQPHAA